MGYITGNPEIDMVENCLCENYNILKKGQLPKSYINKSLDPCPTIWVNPNYINWRNKYIKSFGFPLFAENWVKPLANWIGDRPCLEIMAGTGFFSYALSLYGCKVKATDNYSWENRFDNFINVEKLDCIDAIKKYGKSVKFIICSWPYMDDTAYKSLLAMREVNPKCRMIYVGEGWGGCTANDAFFDNAEFLDIQGFKDAVKNYRRWAGIQDYISLVK